MEGNSVVFADSNFFIASFNPLDALYARALALAEKLDAERISILTSSLIFLETVTVLSQRGTKEIARKAGEHLLSNESISIIHIDETLHNLSWRIFQEVEHKNMSFVDCSILAVLKTYDLRFLLSFDTEDFQKFEKRYQFHLVV